MLPAFTTKAEAPAQPEMLTFPNQVTPQPLAFSPILPNSPALALDLVTTPPTAQQIKMPAQGAFKLIVEAANVSEIQIVDADATDGEARIRVPSQVFDVYVRPETNASAACPTPIAGALSSNQVLDQLDQEVLAKADQLRAAGQSACVYQPSAAQRQNGNCNSTSSGLQCSGALNQTLSAASCPQMVVYGGSLNLNHAFPNTQVFAAVSNNLTINQSVHGVLSSRGSLNSSLNNASGLTGVFVGASSNLNLSGNAKVEGLYAVLNANGLSVNLNPSAVFQGELCATGGNLNRNGNSQLIYDPNQVTPWQSEVPVLGNLMCSAGTKPYTQTIAQACPTAPPTGNASMKVMDGLYYVEQELAPSVEGKWAVLSGRPFPVPADWHSADGGNQALELSNQGVSKLVMRWVKTPGQQASFPPGIKEIGPGGGILELPGVAKLEIPAGGLGHTTVVRMIQALSARSREIQCPYANMPEKCYPGRIFVSPIVQIQPLGLELNKPAKMDIKLFQEAYYHAPYEIGSLGNLDLGTDFWSYELYIALNPELHTIRDLKYDLSIPIKVFAYFSKQALGPRTLGKEDAFRYPEKDSFRIQTVPNLNCSTTHDFLTDHFIIKDKRSNDINLRRVVKLGLSPSVTHPSLRAKRSNLQ